MDNEGKHIDELFRAGLSREENPVAFRESDWERLEQRLNRYAKKKQAVYWLKPLSGVAAILLLAYSVWWAWPEKQVPPAQHTEIVPNERETPEEQHKQLLSSNDQDEPENGSRADHAVSVGANQPAPQAVAGQDPAWNQAEQASQETDRQASGTKTGDDLPLKTTVPESQLRSQPDPVEPDKQPTISDKATERQPAMPGEKPDEPREVPVPQVPVQHEKTGQKHRLLALSLLVAPAYNGVDNLNDGQVGSDFGLLLTLGLTERWSVSTGALYAKKLYETAFSSSYNPGDGPSGHEPRSVDADCRVLDIPLNLNYTVINRAKTTVSLGTGISSYVMLREDYRFNYAYRNGAELEDLRLVNENQHWLSIINLQANYERRLNSKLSISFQPYLKIPLNDIGYARVRLQSLGTAVTANWRF
ncbi:hypothetical protein [Gaoshiqia sp. Z1-71]|uniref:hypothetical protein n=1 Tax=Gaoshiqia hydrogeniformans TaxID=3290090 RepID=UPI003BF7A013